MSIELVPSVLYPPVLLSSGGPQRGAETVSTVEVVNDVEEELRSRVVYTNGTRVKRGHWDLGLVVIVVEENRNVGSRPSPKTITIRDSTKW